MRARTARQTTDADLAALFERMRLQQARIPIRPEDRWDDYYPEFEREASAADDRHQAEKEGC